ncbi:MAG: DUF134 domain-containing protein [Lachnospiraceae bacterium]|nr:DUF134 domain-containing protein [Lachnospiraceae bacterium]
MARPSKPRRVCGIPSCTHFYTEESESLDRPSGLQLSVEEYEVIRLLDYLGFTQQEAADHMETGRTTIQALYTQARRKLARFLVEGCDLTISGGSYQLCPSRWNCRKDFPHSQKGEHLMKIAVTYENGQIFQHFGHTEQFKVYNVEEGVIVSSEIVDTNGQGHGALAGFLLGGGVDVLICGGIGGGARNALAEAGIELYPGAVGDADAQVESFLKGQLVYDPDTMCSHHSHEEGHSCGSHGCGSEGCH